WSWRPTSRSSGWRSWRACTTCASTAAVPASRSSRGTWTRCCGMSPPSAYATSPAPRPPSRNCSCGTTAPRGRLRRPTPSRSAPGERAEGKEHTMSVFTGTGRLTRLALRRDRTKALIWTFGLPALGAASASSVIGLYPTEADRAGYATTTAANVVARAFNGPTAGPSLGSIVTAETFTSLALLTALLSTFMVVRHTRQNEETGRAEIIGSAVVGRHAPLTAALLAV